MLEAANIVKLYDGKPLLRGVSFQVRQGETVCLLGPSGSGKSTLLLIIAGIELAQSGQILWSGRDLTGMPPHLRDFGLMFQDYALFPHLDVLDNVAFGLRMRHWSKESIRGRALEVLRLVGLSELGNRKVTELSGGEQQRVALARALAPSPRLLMFDEPLGALDRALREELLVQLRHILRSTDLPAIYVTHDQSEAAMIADRVLLLHEGQIVREGAMPDVWLHPGSAWAAEFLGVGKVVKGSIMENGLRVETAYGIFNLKCVHHHEVGEHVKLLMRPDETADGSLVRGRVADVVFQQGRFKVMLENGLFVYMDSGPKIGEQLSARVLIECLE